MSITYTHTSGCPWGWGGEKGAFQIPVSSNFCSSAGDDTLESFIFLMKAKQVIDILIDSLLPKSFSISIWKLGNR